MAKYLFVILKKMIACEEFNDDAIDFCEEFNDGELFSCEIFACEGDKIFICNLEEDDGKIFACEEFNSGNMFFCEEFNDGEVLFCNLEVYDSAFEEFNDGKLFVCNLGEYNGEILLSLKPSKSSEYSKVKGPELF